MIVNASTLSAGNYFGQIQVRASGAGNSPTTLVILNVLPPNSTLGPEVRPSGLVFIGTADSAPGSQTVQIAHRGSGATAFKSNRLNYADVVWFSNVPRRWELCPPINRPASPYSPIFRAGARHRSGAIHAAVRRWQRADGEHSRWCLHRALCRGRQPGARVRRGRRLQPRRLAIQVTSPSPSSPRGQINQPMKPGSTSADDCGNPIKDSGGAVKVTFSTGEPGITLQHINNGRWAKTWQPKTGSPPQMVATFTVFAAASNGKTLQDQKDVAVVLDSGAAVPRGDAGPRLECSQLRRGPVGGARRPDHNLWRSPGGRSRCAFHYAGTHATERRTGAAGGPVAAPVLQQQ